MPIDIQNPIATDELAAAFDLVARPKFVLEQTIIPTFSLTDRAWVPGAFRFAIAAGGAGFRSIATAINTGGADRPIKIDKVTVSCATVGTLIILGRPTAALTGLTLLTTISYRDFRRGGTMQMNPGSRNNAAAPALTEFAHLIIGAANTEYTFDNLDITLSGGASGFGADMRGLVVMPNADNVNLFGTIYFREPNLRVTQGPPTR